MPVFDPALRHPFRLPDGSAPPGLAHLARVIDHPNLRFGDRTCASDIDPPEDWAARLAPYLYPGAPGASPDTVIGHDVGIGHGALVLPGGTIGDGAILGAGAVVARDVAPYRITAGNPARIVRPRFPQDVIDRLCALSWWDWEPARIEAAVPALGTGDLPALERLAP